MKVLIPKTLVTEIPVIRNVMNPDRSNGNSNGVKRFGILVLQRSFLSLIDLLFRCFLQNQANH
jgi:hypothetical protein